MTNPLPGNKKQAIPVVRDVVLDKIQHHVLFISGYEEQVLEHIHLHQAVPAMNMSHVIKIVT